MSLLTLLKGPGDYPGLILAQDPALYWRLGETSGTNANDETANNRDGTYTGTYSQNAPSALSGERHGALSLNGAGGVTSSYAPFQNSTIRSFSFWALTDSTAAIASVIGSSHASAGRVLYRPTNRKLAMGVTGGAVVQTTNDVFTVGSWVHAVAIIDDVGDTLDVYLNGAFLESVSLGGVAPFGASNTALGNFEVGLSRCAGTARDFWVGDIDEVAVWTRRLTAQEIADQYTVATSGRFPLGTPQQSGTYYDAVMALDPELYWRFDEASWDESVTDVSGNDHHGFYGTEFGDPDAIVFNEAGAADSNPSVRFPVGVASFARAYDYYPFVLGAQRTIMGVYKADPDRTAGAFELFAGDGPGNVHPCCEVFPAVDSMMFFSQTQGFLITQWPGGTWLGYDHWVHWALTYDATTHVAELFLNGNSYGGGNALNLGDYHPDAGRFEVGMRGTAYTVERYEGWVDEVATFHRILTATEIMDAAVAAGVDTTRPALTITTGPSTARISRVGGKDTVTFSFTPTEDYQAYQIRSVPSTSSPVTAGTLIESGGSGTGGVAKSVDVTDDELVAALGSGEATYTVKAFVQDLAGNWST